MGRLRFYDMRLSSLPNDIGLCSDDTPNLAQEINTAQERLLHAKEAAGEGWWGSWAEILFNVSQVTPYITLPREVARLEAVNLCNRVIPTQNQFFEYLQFGNGRLPKLITQLCPGRPVQVLSRNNAVTFTDVTTPQFIAVYPTDPADVGAARRVFVQGLDTTNSPIYSSDGQNRVQGQFMNLALPFSIVSDGNGNNITFSRITGIQKDQTVGPVQFWSVDPVTGAQVLLLIMEPSETSAWYRRYYLDALPCTCCETSPPPITPGQIQVTAIAKLDLVPVITDTDYLLIQSKEAVIEECKSVRYSRIDKVSAKEMAAAHHLNAIRLLIGQLRHYLGQDEPAVNFKPYGSARLERLNIGMM